MVEKTVEIALTAVSEERPVAVLVQLASQFDSKIHLISGNKKINAKSIMGMMTLGITPGAEIAVTADGSDEQGAIDRISDFLSAK